MLSSLVIQDTLELVKLSTQKISTAIEIAAGTGLCFDQDFDGLFGLFSSSFKAHLRNSFGPALKQIALENLYDARTILFEAKLMEDRSDSSIWLANSRRIARSTVLSIYGALLNLVESNIVGDFTLSLDAACLRDLLNAGKNKFKRELELAQEEEALLADAEKLVEREIELRRKFELNQALEEFVELKPAKEKPVKKADPEKQEQAPGISTESGVRPSQMTLTPWREVKTADGKIYYHNVNTNETAWSLPAHLLPRK